MRDTTVHRPTTAACPWWRDKVAYRVDTRSFNDSDGDGVGDLNGVRSRLGYLELIGVDIVWLTGLLATPVGQPGQGRDVDPVVGTPESFEMLLAEAHAAGMRVIIDLAVSSSGIRERGAHDELAKTLRLWMGLDVDGIRLAAPGLTRPADETTHDILELVRPVVDEYPERLVGALVRQWFTGHGNMHQLDVGVDVRFATVAFEATTIRGVVDEVLAEAGSVGAMPAWGLSDWEHPSPVTRLGGGATGLARARAMALVQSALPGVVGVDNGNELGLPEPEPPDRASRTPVRSLMPWEGSHPPFGFSEASGTWWPSPSVRPSSTVEAQLEDPDSTLSLYRQALEIRQEHGVSRGHGVEWYGAPAGCLAFRRGEDGLTCALNTSEIPVPMPPGEVLLSSSPLDADRLPADTAVWLV